MKLLRVGDSEAAHAVSVTPLLEVPLVGARPPVRVVAADLALVLDVKAMQLVQPVRDWLAIPAERQVERVVDGLVILLVLLHNLPISGAVVMRG